MRLCLPLALCLGAGLVAASAASAAPAPPAAIAFHRAVQAYGGETFPNINQDAPRRRFLITQGYRAGIVASYRAVNPSLKGLLYKQAIYVSSRDSSGTSPANPSAVGWPEAPPSSFLRSAGGGLIYRSGASMFVLADPANTAYQDVWARNAIAQSRRDGWSGVFADDAGLQLYSTTARPARYPDAASWQAAIESFLSRVGQQIRAAGLLFVTNTNPGVTWLDVRQRWLQYVDGTMEEGWMRPSTDPSESLANSVFGNWQRQLREQRDAETAGTWFLAEIPASTGDIGAVRYGLATLLLGTLGASSLDVSGNPPFQTPQWYPEFDQARQLGVATGPFQIRSNGIYTRRFANGLVVVNPTLTGSVVDLGGGTYTGSGVTNVTSAYLAPTSGLVLVRTG